MIPATVLQQRHPHWMMTKEAQSGEQQGKKRGGREKTERKD